MNRLRELDRLPFEVIENNLFDAEIETKDALAAHVASSQRLVDAILRESQLRRMYEAAVRDDESSDR